MSKRKQKYHPNAIVLPVLLTKMCFGYLVGFLDRLITTIIAIITLAYGAVIIGTNTARSTNTAGITATGASSPPSLIFVQY